MSTLKKKVFAYMNSFFNKIQDLVDLFINRIQNLSIPTKAFIGMCLFLTLYLPASISYYNYSKKEILKYRNASTEKINSETISKPISDEKKSEQNLMLNLLFNETEKSVKNAWAININHYFDSATIDKENGTISFNTNPYLEGIIKNKGYVLQCAVYKTGIFTACEIGKTNSYEIADRFGKPIRKEHEVQYVYASTKDNTQISFLFNSNGILKNIVVNFDM